MLIDISNFVTTISMMKRLLLLFASCFLFCVALTAQRAANKKSPEQSSSNLQKGIASYYGAKFAGKQMANGKNFDPTQLTAASNKLSLGVWVRVRNLRNKKSVIVQITDRMHPKNKRLIDVSKAAAQKLGFVSRGLAKVTVEVLENH